ncbi:MAG: ribonuclease HII [Gammaproteobacteria bacterium]|nr:ribonuclease HII [Gammaproteobacteria bacterium]
MLEPALKHIIGVDEAGRGPLAGPVIAYAVILDTPIAGLTDSKKCTPKKRLQLVELIKKHAIAYAYGEANVAEIDKLNIHHATLLAMSRAVEQIQGHGKKVLIDGCFAPNLSLPTETIVQGDLHHASISAASILAKVARDQLMMDYDTQYPQYAFAKHKGYGTAIHMAALREYGPCEIHRQSFAPIQQALRRKFESTVE